MCQVWGVSAGAVTSLSLQGNLVLPRSMSTCWRCPPSHRAEPPWRLSIPLLPPFQDIPVLLQPCLHFCSAFLLLVSWEKPRSDEQERKARRCLTPPEAPAGRVPKACTWSCCLEPGRRGKTAKRSCLWRTRQSWHQHFVGTACIHQCLYQLNSLEQLVNVTL